MSDRNRNQCQTLSGPVGNAQSGCSALCVDVVTEALNREALLARSKGDLAALVLALNARVTALDARFAAAPKTPDNSRVPPSKGQNPDLPDRRNKGRPGRTAWRGHHDHTSRVPRKTTLGESAGMELDMVQSMPPYRE